MKTSRGVVVSAVVAGGLVFSTGVGLAGSTAPEAVAPTPLSAEDERAGELGKGILLSAMDAAEGNVEQAALGAVEEVVDYWLAGLGSDLPDWAKRVEFEWSIQENQKPEWSILTVQPLWESDGLQDTVFTQLSQRGYSMFGDYRNVTNVGLGYRRLLFDNAVLVGVNGFFDYEWENHHQRTSLGAEVKWAGLDFGVNRYWGISSAHSVDNAGTSEEPLDGHDIELRAQVPYLPWARIGARRYWWETKTASEDIKGWEASAEFDLHQNLQVEAGVKSDNFMTDADENEGFVQMRVHLDLGRPVAMSSEFVSASPWLMRDMSEYRLEKVRRENKIIVERRSSGVVIARGS